MATVGRQWLGVAGVTQENPDVPRAIASSSHGRGRDQLYADMDSTNFQHDTGDGQPRADAAATSSQADVDATSSTSLPSG
ncbi:MAG: hypothetical protein QOF51_3471, partial [Chloroflexota bacterium]|nr:hypothetical protein [Chloroflexota bacterium]